MKTLILYATKHGAAAEIARRIAGRIEGAALHDLKSKAPNLAEYDCVIAGSSVYAGMIRKEAKSFLAENAETLCGKRLGLFLSGMSANEEQKVFEENVPRDVLNYAKATAFLGGIYDPKKVGFAERLIMKAVAKLTEYTDMIDDEKIEQFLHELN